MCNTILFYILSTNIDIDADLDPIGNTVRISELIAEKSILIVLSAVMVFSWLAMFMMFLVKEKKQNKAFQKLLNEVNIKNDTVIEQTKLIHNLLLKIECIESKENLEEQSKENANRLIKKSLQASTLELLKMAKEIIRFNHISEKDYTHNRVFTGVSRIHLERVNYLNNFKYDGFRLGDLSNTDEWIDRKTKIIEEFIYSKDRDEERLMRELSLLNADININLKL